MKSRKPNRDGSARKISQGVWECVVQSTYINPDTGKPKRVKRRGPTEAEARKLAKAELGRWEKAFIDTYQNTKVDKTKTFGQYMHEFLDNVIRPTVTDSGYKSYYYAMRNNFHCFPIANLQLHMLNKKVFQQYYDELSKLKSYKTCMFPRQICIRCLKWLKTNGLIEENYAEQATLNKKVIDEYDRERQKNKQKEIFTPEDIQKFYYAYKNNMGQYPVVALFLLETGMRASEFATLRNENINLETGRVDIVESRSTRFVNNDPSTGKIEEYIKVPKNKKERFVMLSDLGKECVKYMQEQTKLHCKCNTEDILYPSFINGRRRTLATMEVGFHTLCDKLGIDRDVRMTSSGVRKGLCLHSLRHTADSMANAAAGANVINTALMMGHTAVSTENVYTHATEEGLKTVTTPSQIVLDDFKKEEVSAKPQEEKAAELYNLYLKLKDMFDEKS